MKILAYEVRPDEQLELRRQADLLGIELHITEEVPALENVHLADGCDGVSTLGQGRLDGALLEALKQKGVRYLSTRTLGYDHIDLAKARELGLRVCNSRYDPNGVADFAVMLMLMCLRRYNQTLQKGSKKDFSLKSLQGKEMKDITVGLIGTGRIGAQVAKNLSGFGCRILAHDLTENAGLANIVTYVEKETLFSEADIVSLHMPLLASNYHMINQETIGKMRDGAILINCSRGELVDSDALLEALEQGKISAAGLDTCEDEVGIIHCDLRGSELPENRWTRLRCHPNVVLTPHMAFYTEAAVASMVECGIRGIWEMANGISCATEITGVQQSKLRWE